ncbi:MAG: PaaI family thioesterase [Proteobacteria bacterium]|nr:PaaI family thioesterase [Pseudomonadota bacterium]
MKTHEIFNSKDCFVCGKNNPIGLKLCYKKMGDGVIEAEFTPHKDFIGFAGILHGGIISSVLDDAMDWALYLGTDKWYVTVKIAVEFKKSGTVEKPLKVRAWVVNKDGDPYHLDLGSKKTSKVLHARAELLDEDNEVIASSEGKFFQLPGDKLVNLPI